MKTNRISLFSKGSTVNTFLSGMPTIYSLIGQIQKNLKKGNIIEVLYYEIKEFENIQFLSGLDICYQILTLIAELLLQVKSELKAKGWKLDVAYGGADNFFFFIYGEEHSDEVLQEISLEIKNRIIIGLKTTTFPRVEIYSSYHLLQAKNDTDDINYLFYRELKEAGLKARDQYHRVFTEKRDMMFSIINQVRVYPVYQPIVSLKTGEIFGYEALIRGDSTLQMNPLRLFDLARKTGTLLDFERLARELAIKGGMKRRLGEKLFINITPEVINEIKFRQGQTHNYLQEYNYSEGDIIFEVTEDSAIKDFSLFHQVVGHYRNKGYKIAVDDAGSGFSTLQVIAELNPNFIKIDMSLIRDIDKTPIKEALVQALVDFSCKMGVKLVAEGIETYQELDKILDMGIDFGQGFLIARPGEINQKVNLEVVEFILNHPVRRKEIIESLV